MVTYESASYGEQYGAEEPACSADHQEFRRSKMTETEDIAKVVLWKTRDEKEKEDEEGAPVMKKIVEALHYSLVNELVDKGPAEGPGKGEGGIRTGSKADSRKHSAEHGAVNKTSQKSRDFTGHRGSDYLCHLKENEAYETEGAEGLDKGLHLFLAGEEPGNLVQDMDKRMDYSEVVQDPREQDRQYDQGNEQS